MTFLKAGKVVVEVSSVEGQKKTEIEVEYTQGYASDLLLDVQSIDMSINDGGVYISYSTLPQSVDVDVEFYSDDENVAYVDDSGYVQFMGGGSTLVRARIKKSQETYIEKTVIVNVSAPATGIILDDNYLVATQQFKLNPTSYPSNSTNTDFYFYSSDTSFAIVDENGLVTFLKERYGSVSIEVFANKEKNVEKTVMLTYTVG